MSIHEVRCKHNIEILNVGLQNSFKWYRDDLDWQSGSYFMCVGKFECGKLTSYLKKDIGSGPNNLMKLIATNCVVTRQINPRYPEEVYYYLEYDVPTHSSHKDVVTNIGPLEPGETYETAFEFVFAYKGYKRTIVWRFINDARDVYTLEEVIKDFEAVFMDNFDVDGREYEGIWLDDENDCINVLFYDKLGRERELDFSDAKELLSCLVSARQIELKKK